MREVAADDPVAVRLIEAMGAEMQARYGDGGLSPAQPQQFLAPGIFLLAELDGIAVGCGGVRPSGENAAEIKRMYVDPAARGRGIGRLLLKQVEELGRSHGSRRR